MISVPRNNGYSEIMTYTLNTVFFPYHPDQIFRNDFCCFMVRVIESKCIGCNACIRACPVLVANRYDGNVVHVNTDACIQCGKCIKHCLHGAREFVDDIDRLFEDLGKGKRISLVVAPAIKTAMDGKWRHVLQWLKSKGVNKFTILHSALISVHICI